MGVPLMISEEQMRSAYKAWRRIPGAPPLSYEEFRSVAHFLINDSPSEFAALVINYIFERMLDNYREE
jgi:hypothetical protein